MLLVVEGRRIVHFYRYVWVPVCIRTRRPRPGLRMHTEGHLVGTFGHLFFLTKWPDTQITVNYVSSHFAEKDRCPNVLPDAEAWPRPP